MVDALAVGLIAAGLVLCAWCLVSAAQNRTANLLQLGWAALVELAVIAQVTVAVVTILGGTRPRELGVFVGYLIATPLVLPGGAALANAERTRWGAVLLGVSGLVLVVLVLRLQQVWRG